MATLTSANSTLALAITDIYPAPQLIEGFATDDLFNADPVTNAEIMMGADGKLSAGFVFEAYKMNVILMPTSPSLAIFETWASTQVGAQEIYPANGSIILPGINRKYTLTNGILTTVKPFADVKKTLQPIPFVITWEKITPEQI
ncbi:phage tail fiber protein [Curvibacter lanceolatus]|uniref:phage tail fiber protein n=1 Tax=Curvibacter lanceolatus TaxID=86182 RepID=UPI00036008B1|nr:hypothetical protein [Curvibacter lanceolatus]